MNLNQIDFFIISFTMVEENFENPYIKMLQNDPKSDYFLHTMVKKMIMKLVKLRATLDHPQICIFKIFFNHGEGNMVKMSQIESKF